MARDAIKEHAKHRGKLSVVSKIKVKSNADLSVVYTPGVGEVSRAISKKPALADELTGIGNSVAIVSDGSAVLGLGNIGPAAAMPVMEGKALLFKQFADIDGFPVVLRSQKPKDIIDTVVNIAPTYGGVNLEDIKAPQCFEIENALVRKLNIPVMHDDQHGTAIVVLAGLINALKVVGKDSKGLKVVVVGAGAAGSAVARILVNFKIKNVIVLDSKGALYKGRTGMDKYKRDLAARTNPQKLTGKLGDIIKDADVIVGVSGPKSINKTHIKKMADKSIVFALANPIPEIYPEDAKQAGAAVIATGRSDFPNQVNNALAFPGVFRGALDNKVKKISEKHKVEAARVIAAMIKKPTAEQIIPSVFTKKLVKSVAAVIV